MPSVDTKLPSRPSVAESTGTAREPTSVTHPTFKRKGVVLSRRDETSCVTGDFRLKEDGTLPTDPESCTYDYSYNGDSDGNAANARYDEMMKYGGYGMLPEVDDQG